MIEENRLNNSRILTDEMCANDGCSVPLMRSPKGLPSTKFCARCNEDPEGNSIEHTYIALGHY